MAAGALLAQETPLTRLKREALRTQTQPLDKLDPEPLHRALLDWLEWRLPQFENSTTQVTHVEASLSQELKEAGILDSQDEEDPWKIKPGYVDFSLKQLPELTHVLFVTASVTVPCGSDDAVYMYHYALSGRTRVIENDRAGYYGPDIVLSEPDSQGRRPLLIHFTSTQCNSAWMDMAYSVYRLSTSTSAADLLLSDHHSFWLGNDGPEFVLQTEELMIEFLDRSVDGGIHNRTNIERFNFVDGVRRVDPVAFQPQDFVEEWLVRPWSEMESRSDASTKTWHDRLHADDVFGDYQRVVACTGLPGHWLISPDIDQKKRTHFLVHDLGSYRYLMESVSETKPKGCPGPGLSGDSGPASDKHPWLTEVELKTLP
jgi:hypothetical protein